MIFSVEVVHSVMILLLVNAVKNKLHVVYAFVMEIRLLLRVTGTSYRLNL